MVEKVSQLRQEHWHVLSNDSRVANYFGNAFFSQKYLHSFKQSFSVASSKSISQAYRYPVQVIREMISDFA